MCHAMNLAMKKWEWIDSNPTSKVAKERVHNEIIRWLTFEEELRLLDASPEWIREIIIFPLNTGLRREELIDLTWDRIDIVNKTFTILEQKNREKNTLPLNEKALEILIKRDKVGPLGTITFFTTKAGTGSIRTTCRGLFVP